MDYLDFELDISPISEGGGYNVALNSPAGQAVGKMQFPFGQLELQNKILTLQVALLRSGGSQRGPSTDAAAVEQLGRDLFKALFSGDIGTKPGNRQSTEQGIADPAAEHASRAGWFALGIHLR
jgi:hypothetical protein